MFIDDIDFSTSDCSAKLDYFFANVVQDNRSKHNPKFFTNLSGVIGEHREKPRIMASVFDLRMTLSFLERDGSFAGDIWNNKITREKGVKVHPIAGAQARLEMVQHHQALVFRARAYWDKYFGLLILLFDPEHYDKYLGGKSQLTNFKKWLSKQEPLPRRLFAPILYQMQKEEKFNELVELLEHPVEFQILFGEVLSAKLERLNLIRTAEAHNTGTLRKWGLAKDPTIVLGQMATVIEQTNFVNCSMNGIIDYSCLAPETDFWGFQKYKEAKERMENSR